MTEGWCLFSFGVRAQFGYAKIIATFHGGERDSLVHRQDLGHYALVDRVVEADKDLKVVSRAGKEPMTALELGLT